VCKYMGVCTLEALGTGAHGAHAPQEGGNCGSAQVTVEGGVASQHAGKAKNDSVLQVWFCEGV
jgi:hypothetical protein